MSALSYKRRGNGGFSLVELLVTVVLAGIIFLAMVPLFVSVLKKSSTDTRRVVATNLAQARVDKVKMLAFADITPANLNSTSFAAGQFNTSFTPAKGGLPYTISSSSNPSGNGEGADRAVQIANPLAGISHALVPASGGNGAYVQWFDPSAFEDAPTGTYSPTRRGQNFGPGYGALDLALLKSTQIRESVSIQFRADMFNLFNRMNLAPIALPNTTVSSGGVDTETIGAFMGNPGVGPGEPFNALFTAKIIF